MASRNPWEFSAETETTAARVCETCSRTCHWKPRTGHILDWKTNEPQNTIMFWLKNLYFHMLKIQVYKIRPNCTSKQVQQQFMLDSQYSLSLAHPDMTIKVDWAFKKKKSLVFPLPPVKKETPHQRSVTHLDARVGHEAAKPFLDGVVLWRLVQAAVLQLAQRGQEQLHQPGHQHGQLGLVLQQVKWLYLWSQNAAAWQRTVPPARSPAWSAGSCRATGEMITALQSECSSPAKNSPTSMVLVLQPAKIIISLQSKCSSPAKNSSSVRSSAWSAGSCPATGEMITTLQSECSCPAKNSPTSMVLVLQPAKIITSLQSERCCPANCTSMVSWVLSCDHRNNYISLKSECSYLGKTSPFSIVFVLQPQK